MGTPVIIYHWQISWTRLGGAVNSGGGISTTVGIGVNSSTVTNNKLIP